MTKKVDIAIIGGSGIYTHDLLKDAEEVHMSTPYGSPSDAIIVGEFHGRRVAFLPRHGRGHVIPPHNIPFRANIFALNELGVKQIIAPSAVGSLQENMKPGDLVFADQFFDFTKSRPYTFYDGEEIGVAHVGVADPFCATMRKIACVAAEKLNLSFHEHGTSVTIQGPRYSTKAESRFYREAVKAHVVGMTLVPECVLAREMEMCYLNISSVTDFDTWHGKPVDTLEVQNTMKKNIAGIRKLITEILPHLPKERKCECATCMKNAKF